MTTPDASIADTSIADTLRGRVLRGIRAGTLKPGDRLPSVRTLQSEFVTDHRRILAAYTELAEEGLVEVRERGGVYVRDIEHAGRFPLPIQWLVDLYSEAYAREVPATELVDLVRRSIETVRLRATLVVSGAEHGALLVDELTNDFGLLISSVDAAEVDAPESQLILRRSDILLATTRQADLLARMSERLGISAVTLALRPDLTPGEWAMLLRQPTWTIVGSEAFGAMLVRMLGDVKGVENLHVLVHGRDDLSAIPPDAPVHVTHRVREALGEETLGGRLLSPGRTISPATARQLLEFMIRTNLRAVSALQSGVIPPAARASVNGTSNAL